MPSRELTALQGEVKSISANISGMTGWMKDIRSDVKDLKNHVANQNGKIGKSELKIALIEQRLQLKKEYESKKERSPDEITLMDKLEFMSRRKLMGLIVAFLTVMMFAIQLLLEFFKTRMFS